MGSESSPIRAFLISDVRLYREGVETALRHSPAVVIIGTAGRVDAALDQVTALAPHAVIIDMATADSLPGVRALAAAAPRAKIVAFAVDELTCDIASYAEAGISGYVPCEASLDELVRTITCVVRDETPCSPRVAAALFRRLAVLADHAAPQVSTLLTRREHQILGLIRSGLSNKEIAQALTIEVATVKNHVHSVLAKLHVATRAEAATLTVRGARHAGGGRI